MACCCGHPALVHERTGPSRTGDGACQAPGCECLTFVAGSVPRISNTPPTWLKPGPNVPPVGPHHITTRRAGQTVREDPYTGTEIDL